MKKRLFALMLVLQLFLTLVGALAKSGGDLNITSTTDIVMLLKENKYTLEDFEAIGLEKEALFQWLVENDIAIVDEVVQIETEDQIIALADYYEKNKQVEAVGLGFTEEQKAFYEQFVDIDGNHFSVSVWENYLADGGITTDENGNIIGDTFEKFEHFSLGYQKYCANNGVNYSIEEARSIVMYKNLENMSKELKELLIEGKFVLEEYFEDPFKITEITKKALITQIGLAEANCQNRQILESLAIWNKENRELQMVFDQYVHNYISSLEKEKSGMIPDYMYGLSEMYRIVVGKSENTPELSKMSSSAPYIFFVSAYEISRLICGGGGIPLIELSGIIYDQAAAISAINAFSTSFELDVVSEVAVKNGE